MKDNIEGFMAIVMTLVENFNLDQINVDGVGCVEFDTTTNPTNHDSLKLFYHNEVEDGSHLYHVTLYPTRDSYIARHKREAYL